MDERRKSPVKLRSGPPDATPMNSAHSYALHLPCSAAAPAARQGRSLWFHYRNARMWGKPMLWSVRYAREAQLKFG